MIILWMNTILYKQGRITLCRSNVKTAYNSNYPKSWLLLLRMVDRDQTNMKLEKKNTFGGSGGPQGAILG